MAPMTEHSECFWGRRTARSKSAVHVGPSAVAMICRSPNCKKVHNCHIKLLASHLGNLAFQRLYIHFMIFSYHVWYSGWIYLFLSLTCAWKNRDSVASSQVWGSCHEGGCEASRRTAPGEASGWKWSLLKDGNCRRNHSGFTWFHAERHRNGGLGNQVRHFWANPSSWRVNPLFCIFLRVTCSLPHA